MDGPERTRPGEPLHYPGEKVRGGEIVLRSGLQRWIFIGGLAGFVILAVVMRIVGVW